MLPNSLMCIAFLGILEKIVQSTSYRKIKDGKRVEVDTVRYIVYLTKAEKSETEYDAWICGGAIVSPSFIVTSAACVEDVQYMYAISGYSKYINGLDINNDECTYASKKKVVFVCVPRKYEFAYDRIEKWAFIDIAAVKVESPYRFEAPVLPGCSWTPNKIQINYDPVYQQPNIDAIVMGWGHNKKWRKPGDPTDYNQQELQYSSILIMSKAECKKRYHTTPELIPIIDAYMICAMNEGNLNDKGKSMTKKTEFNKDGCTKGSQRSGNDCEEPSETYKENDRENNLPLINKPQNVNEKEDEISSHITNDPVYHTPKPFEPQHQQNRIQYQNQQNDPPYIMNPPANDNLVNEPKLTMNTQIYQNVPKVNQEDSSKDETPIPVKETQAEYDDDVISFEDIIMNVRRTNRNHNNGTRYTRKAGICQNDHGGPLVTWVGRKQRLIGVASVFRIDKSSNCVGPYLFTSTQCNGAFLDCIIESYDPEEDERYIKEYDDPIDIRDYDMDYPITTHLPTSSTKSTRKRKTLKPFNMSDLYPDPVITGEQLRTRKTNRDICHESPAKRGFEIVERTISWKYHPDGPAQSELPDN